MLGTQKRGPVCGMRAALSRRHVHGLLFQPPATGGIHRIASGVAQEPADAQSRHAAPRVAFVPLLKPRLHVTLHPVAVIAETGRKRTRDSDEFSGADTTGEMKAKIDRDMTSDRKKAKFESHVG